MLIKKVLEILEMGGRMPAETQATEPDIYRAANRNRSTATVLRFEAVGVR
jgi:hypothetical protein